MDVKEVYAWVCEMQNWPIITAGLYVADKVVKATPWKADDFVVDVVIGGLKKLIPGRTSEEDKSNE